MELKDIARKLPEEIWEVFKPLLPKVVWVGNGRPPCSNRDCLHGVLYVLVTGIPWEMMPKGFPSYKTCLSRFKAWLRLGVFQKAWQSWLIREHGRVEEICPIKAKKQAPRFWCSASFFILS